MGVGVEESRFHVLAVDDSLLDRKLIERLLKSSSYQVTAVDYGTKALKFLGLNNSDDDGKEQQRDAQPEFEMEVSLIITDYCMPGMTGYDLLKKIKVKVFRCFVVVSYPLFSYSDLCIRSGWFDLNGDMCVILLESATLRNIPVVIMSSEHVPSRINRCLEEGADEFLLKPVQLADMDKLKPHIMKQKPFETQHNNSKRKSMEEIHSPDKSRLRCDDGLEVVAS